MFFWVVEVGLGVEMVVVVVVGVEEAHDNNFSKAYKVNFQE